ncbi:MAG: LysR family transcriptional regulator [Pseudomonadota bacterium]
MQSRAPNLSSLRAFEAAARRESFAEAAEELGLTPAAVSRAVRRLEDELGFDLFLRSHRAVSLTEQGARYAQKVTEGFRHLAVPDESGAPRKPRVTLDVEATFLRQWLLPRLAEPAFRDLDISLSIRAHHDPPRVIPAAADLAVVWGYADYSGFKRTRLVSPRTILVAAPKLAVSHLSEVAETCLIHEANDHWWRLVYAEAGESYPENADALTLTRCDLPVEAARLGIGVAVADDVIAERELRSGALRPVQGPRLDSQDYYLMSRKTVSVPAKAFVAWIRTEAELFASWQASLP